MKSSIFRVIFATVLTLGAAGVVAGSCGGDDETSGVGDSCSLGGQKCEFGCDHDLGCVRCLGSSDCGSGEPFCVLGGCVQCKDNADCGTTKTCWPRHHTCEDKCAANDDCPGEEPICDTTGACVGCVTNEDCAGTDKPLCHPTLHQCSECLLSTDCPATQPACDFQDGECRECLVDSDCHAPDLCGSDHHCHFSCDLDIDCTEADRSHCDVESHDCVECLSDAHCAAPEPFCGDHHRCAVCRSDADCASIPDTTTPYCHDGEECVECLRDEHCTDPLKPECKGRVCQS